MTLRGLTWALQSFSGGRAAGKSGGGSLQEQGGDQGFQPVCGEATGSLAAVEYVAEHRPSRFSLSRLLLRLVALGHEVGAELIQAAQ